MRIFVAINYVYMIVVVVSMIMFAKIKVEDLIIQAKFIKQQNPLEKVPSEEDINAGFDLTRILIIFSSVISILVYFFVVHVVIETLYQKFKKNVQTPQATFCSV
jgi:hypothetical protein